MQHTEKKSRGSGFALLIWLAAGLITAAVGMLMYTSGSRNINQFYDGGKVYDVGIYERNANVLNMRYDAAEQRFVITEDAACKIVYLSGMEETWNYMRMELRSMNRESLEGTVVYYNKNGNVFSQPVLLREEKISLKQTEFPIPL